MTSRIGAAMGRYGMAVVGALVLVAAPAFGQQTHVLVITGLSGDPAYAEQFLSLIHI